MIAFFGLLAGFALLVCGANWFVTGASGLAARLRVPTIIIGLTVVAFGTSAPELAVSMTASVQGANEIALGNVIGSNLFNLLAVVGISAMAAPLAAPLVTPPELLRRDWIASIGASGLLLVFALVGGEISRLDAACLLICFASVLILQINHATKQRLCADDLQLPEDTLPPKQPDPAPLSKRKIALYSLVGLGCIILGGQASVTAASSIARQFGLSESLIGLTIVAIGTSLPELVTSVIATRRGETDIAIGNVIGSNLFNALFILGISCLICPIGASIYLVTDTLLLLIISVGMYALAKANHLHRTSGALLSLGYLGYTLWVVLR
ncbi:MAG: calcium/sodium antiporter [Faecalibacterium sp.]